MEIAGSQRLAGCPLTFVVARRLPRDSVHRRFHRHETVMPEDRTAPSTAQALSTPARDEIAASTPSNVLPSALFEIAISAMWSDGELATRAVERGHALSRVLHSVPPRGGSPFGAIAAGPLPFGELEFDVLGSDECRIAYAIALWVGCPGAQPSSARQKSFCRGLQQRLRIDDGEAAMLSDVVAAVETTAESEDAHASLGLLLAALGPLSINGSINGSIDGSTNGSIDG